MPSIAIAGLLMLLVSIAAAFAFFGLAALSDMPRVCPDGNQCSDAVSTVWFSVAVVSACVAAGAFTIWLANRH